MVPAGTPISDRSRFVAELAMAKIPVGSSYAHRQMWLRAPSPWEGPKIALPHPKSRGEGDRVWYSLLATRLSRYHSLFAGVAQG